MKLGSFDSVLSFVHAFAGHKIFKLKWTQSVIKTEIFVSKVLNFCEQK